MPFVETRFISPTTLTTSAASALYTVPTGYSAIIKQLVVTNISASAATFTLYINSAVAGSALFSNTSVAANDTVIINLSQVLTTGETLRALASTGSALNLTVSGVLNDGPLASTATYIADNAITVNKIADGSITTSKIADGAIVTVDIANNAVTQAKLASTLSGTTVTTTALRSTDIPSPFKGQMAYLSDTDILQIYNGSSWRTIAATTPTNGTVLQIVTGTSNTQVGTGSTTYVDAGLSATITPKSSTSKVMVFAQINWYNAATNKTTFNLVRGSTQINETNPLGGDANNLDGGHFLTVLDSPATTSATTYKVQYKTGSSAGYLRASATATCTIFLMEIAG